MTSGDGLFCCIVLRLSEPTFIYQNRRGTYLGLIFCSYLRGFFSAPRLHFLYAVTTIQIAVISTEPLF